MAQRVSQDLVRVNDEFDGKESHVVSRVQC